LCHLGFLFRSYKDLTSKAKNNLSPAVNGIILKYRITGLNDNNYNLVDYLQKNDEEITYFRTLFDNTDILSDFYKNKSFVVLKNITFIDRSNNSVTLDLGTQSIANYYVNGDPSKTVTIQYYVYGLSGQGGINMTFGPLKTLSVSPIEVKDGEEGTRYTSQLPRLLTSTSSRVNNIIQINLYNLNINLMAYRFKYCALTINEEVVSGVAGVALLSGYTYYRANMNRVAAENRFLSGKEGNEYETAKEIIKNMRQFLSDRSTPEVKLTNLQNISLSANKAGLSKSNEINRAFNDNKLTTAEDLSKAYNDVLDSVRNGLTNTAGLSEQFKQSLANYIDEAKGGFTDFVNSSGQITRLSQLANDADEEVSDYLGHLDI